MQSSPKEREGEEENGAGDGEDAESKRDCVDDVEKLYGSAKDIKWKCNKKINYYHYD
jgi:hypothetical protein